VNFYSLLKRVTEYEPHVVMICETWEHLHILPGYTLIHRKTDNSPYGGLSIYSRADLVIISTPEIQIQDEPNTLVAKLIVAKSKHLFIILSYFPPRMNNTQWEKQFNRVRGKVMDLSRAYLTPQIMWYADFNRDISRKIVSGHKVVNFEGTRTQAGVTSNLDFLIVHDNMLVQAKKRDPIGRSDHCSIHANILTVGPPTRKRIEYIDRAELVKVAREELSKASDIDSFLGMFQERLEASPKRFRKHRKLPLLTEFQRGILKIAAQTSNYKAYKEETENLWKEILQMVVGNRKKDPGTFWKTITKRKDYRKKRSLVTTISANGRTLEGRERDEEMARHFSQFYLSHGARKIGDIPDLPSLKPHPEILAKGKALGPDLVPDDILEDILKRPDSSEWLRSRTAFHHLTARICLINKTESLIPQLKDTRPIAIQSLPFKIMESALAPKIRELNNAKTSRSQFGFKANMSTHLPQVILARKILKDRANPSCKLSFTMFVDLRKAYDSIYRHHFLQVVRRLLTSEEFTLLVTIYTYNKLVFGDEKISPQRGLLQGSIISPHLFNLVIDPLVRKLETIMTTLVFADDIALHGNDVRAIEEALKAIENWGIKGHEPAGVEINFEKSGIVVHRASNGKDRKSLKAFAQRHGIPIVTSYKYLGTTFTKGMTMQKILKDIDETMRRRAGCLARLALAKKQVYAATLAYQATVLPLLAYHLPVLTTIEKMTGKQAVRKAMDLHYRHAKKSMSLPAHVSRTLVDALVPKPITLLERQMVKIMAKVILHWYGGQANVTTMMEKVEEIRKEAKEACTDFAKEVSQDALFLLTVSKTASRRCPHCEKKVTIVHAAKHQLNPQVAGHLEYILTPGKEPYII